METGLEYAIRLNAQSEFPSLYEWSLEEWGPEGLVCDGNVGWFWPLYFLASDLRRVFLVESSNHDNEHVTESEYILGKLTPEPFEGISTTYSMFGTNRRISDFSIRIVAAEEEERCTVWGTVAYEYEWDFEIFKRPDALQITLSLAENRYRRLADAIRSKETFRLELSIGRVDGFYAPWTPRNRTETIKILTNSELQKLDMPEVQTFNVRRLSNAKEFTLRFIDVVQELNREAICSVNESSQKDERNLLAEFRVLSEQVLSLRDDQSLRQSVRSIQFAVWSLFIILSLNLMTRL
jgi:hypothetical protein